MNDRFARLAALTRGATVITISVGSVGGATAGCTKSDSSPPAPIAASSALFPQAAQAEPTDADVDGGVALIRRRRFPIPNAMHPGWRLRDGGAGSGEGGTNGGP
jgi:hypothetical protein